MAKVTLADLTSLSNPASAVQTINENMDAIATAMENTLSRDGETPNTMEADIDLNGYKLLNVDDPEADTDGVNLRSIRGLVEQFAEELVTDEMAARHIYEKFVATAAQTTFVLADGEPANLSNTYVFDDGVHMIPGEDYSLVDGNTIEFAVGRTVGHEILVRYLETLSIGTGDASMIQFTQRDAGAINERTVEDKLFELVSVMDYGAVGDGVANDSAAFLDALTVAKRVLVPEGIYLVDNLSIPSSRKLFGEGVGSVIKPFSAAAPQLMLRVNANSDIEISNLSLYIDSATYTTKEAIWGQGCDNIHVHDITMEDAGYIGVHFVDAVACRVERVNISSALSNGILFGGTANVRNTVTDCLVSTPGSTLHGIAVHGGTRCVVSRNNINQSGLFGVQFNDCQYCTMSNNTAYNTTKEAFNASDSSFNLITGNVAIWDGVEGEDFGISLAAVAADSSLNIISNNIVVNSNKSGIAVAAVSGFDAIGNVILGNTVYNPNILNEAQGAGILMYGPDAIGTIVKQNTLYGGGTMKYGVYDYNVGGRPIQTQVVGNRVVSAVTASIGRNTANAASMEALNGAGNQTYTPVVTPSVGAITAYSINAADYQELEKLVWVDLDVTITTNGTGSGELRITLPYTAGADRTTIWAGREGVTGGAMLQGVIDPGTTYVRVLTYANAYPAANGTQIRVGGWYERE